MDAFLDGFLEPYFTPWTPTTCSAWRGSGSAAMSPGTRAATSRRPSGRITAKTFVMPIDEDMFFPVRDCAAEQAHIKGSELRVVNDVLGHLGLFSVNPDYMPQVDRHLSELLDTDVAR